LCYYDLTINLKEIKMYQKILVPLDGSEIAECVLLHVESVVKDYDTTEIILIRIVQPSNLPIGTLLDEGDDFSEKEAAETMQKADTAAMANAKSYLEGISKNINYCKVKTEALMGKAAEKITDYADNNAVDLIIIATHGRSGPSRWVYGSVADRILRSSCVPVLMVRAPGCYIGVLR
jgi:nucleotide-binding universal stress UspA family protein